jgi:hypothetical protein
MMMQQQQENARLTGIRREVKYLIPPAGGKKALEALQKRVPAKIVDGSASSYRVSIYLDDAERTFSGSELKNHHMSTKMRVREYYLMDGSLPLFGEKSFIEVKTRAGQIVEKSRFAVKRSQIARALTDGPPPATEPSIRSAHEAFEATRNGRVLEPLFVVHYRRFTLQDKESRMRITCDDMLSYHMPPEGLTTHPSPICSRRDLPPPFLVEPNWVVEIKSLGRAPSWVDEILDPEYEIGYSKFGTGVRELDRRGWLIKK